MDRAEKFDNHVDALVGMLNDVVRDLMVVGAEDAEIGTLSARVLNVLGDIHKMESETLGLVKMARELELAEWEKAVL